MQKAGLETWNFPVEVGCRGFPAQTVWRMFSALGITGKNRRAAVQKISQTAERDYNQSGRGLYLSFGTLQEEEI